MKSNLELYHNILWHLLYWREVEWGVVDLTEHFGLSKKQAEYLLHKKAHLLNNKIELKIYVNSRIEKKRATKQIQERIDKFMATKKAAAPKGKKTAQAKQPEVKMNVQTSDLDYIVIEHNRDAEYLCGDIVLRKGLNKLKRSEQVMSFVNNKVVKQDMARGLFRIVEDSNNFEDVEFPVEDFAASSESEEV